MKEEIICIIIITITVFLGFALGFTTMELIFGNKQDISEDKIKNEIKEQIIENGHIYYDNQFYYLVEHKVGENNVQHK